MDWLPFLALLSVSASCAPDEPRPASYPSAQPYPQTAPAYASAPAYGAPNAAANPAYGTPAYAPAPGQAQLPAPAAAPAQVPGAAAPNVAASSTAFPSVASAPVPFDPINLIDVNYLRGRAASVMGELVANLPEPQQSRVRGIPLVTDNTVGEVNAFATCTESGKPAMAITDGLLDIQAHLAQARATDELFGTHKVDEYVRFIAQNQKPNTPVAQPPLGMFDPAQSADGRKVARQHDVLDEQIAFVLGHELAHHYLGHLPCTQQAGTLSAAELGRVLSDTIPIFNQPNEIAADMSGINNALTTGYHRAGYHFSEGGALLTMQFFSGIDQFSPVDILFGFERTHPPPAIRTPIIQQTAAAWRTTGGRGLPILSL